VGFFANDLFSKGAVLAAELKSNANKLAQWTARAILAGAEKMLFGYVCLFVVFVMAL
jgi:Eukaryotic translation initiation factor 3 subunit 7 (eIF-3)